MKKWQNGNNFNVHKMGLIYINASYTFLNFFCYFREKYDLDMLLRGFMSFFFFQVFFFFQSFCDHGYSRGHFLSQFSQA